MKLLISALTIILALLANSVTALADEPAREAVEEAPPTTGGEPSIPEVDDPMLAPVVPPAHSLARWQDAVQRVRGSSSTLRIARARVDEANAQSRQALAGALPTLVGDANLNHHLLRGRGTTIGAGGIRPNSDIPDPATTWNAGLLLRQPIFAPAAWHGHGTAKSAARAARLSGKEAERQALAIAADAILGVLTAGRVSDISRGALRSALSTLLLTKTRARLGAASAIDVLRAEQEVALTRAQVVSADESVYRTREVLGLALGESDAWGVAAGVDLRSLAKDARGSCRQEATVEARPDVRAAAASVEVAERSVDAVDWEFAPTLDLVSDATYLSEDRFSPNGKHVTWTVGAQLVWPLYDGGRRYGTREASHSQLRVAREQHTDAARRATMEVSQARRGIGVARATLAVSEQSRQIAKESARLAQVAFIHGAGTSFDLVDAARRLREAELDLAIKQFEVVRAEITALLALSTCTV